MQKTIEKAQKLLTEIRLNVNGYNESYDLSAKLHELDMILHEVHMHTLSADELVRELVG